MIPVSPVLAGLHDLFVTFEAMTPGEHKRRGTGLEIGYGFHPTPFGECLLATTPRGICALRFVATAVREQTLTQLQAEWPGAQFVHRPAVGEPLVQPTLPPRRWSRQRRRSTCCSKARTSRSRSGRRCLPSPLAGWQVTRLWQRISPLPLPPAPWAASIARNPIAYLIPCHRVITKVGAAHRYRWGTAKKQAMIGWEASRLHTGPLTRNVIPSESEESQAFVPDSLSLCSAD